MTTSDGFAIPDEPLYDADGNPVIDDDGNPVTWIDLMALAGEKLRAEGYQLEISEDPVTGETLYRVKDQD